MVYVLEIPEFRVYRAREKKGEQERLKLSTTFYIRDLNSQRDDQAHSILRNPCLFFSGKE
jgi:hypothetical protein